MDSFGDSDNNDLEDMCRCGFCSVCVRYGVDAQVYEHEVDPAEAFLAATEPLEDEFPIYRRRTAESIRHGEKVRAGLTAVVVNVTHPCA